MQRTPNFCIEKYREYIRTVLHHAIHEPIVEFIKNYRDPGNFRCSAMLEPVRYDYHVSMDYFLVQSVYNNSTWKETVRLYDGIVEYEWWDEGGRKCTITFPLLDSEEELFQISTTKDTFGLEMSDMDDLNTLLNFCKTLKPDKDI